MKYYSMKYFQSYTKYTKWLFFCKQCNNYSKFYSTIENSKKIKVSPKSTKYKDTILFPSKIEFLSLSRKKRTANEKKILTNSTAREVYNQQPQSSKTFILHDGPPYANGKLHMGHAFNKILKDIIVRFKFMSGHRVNFIPGWDCHGLPIELKALQKSKPGQVAEADWENLNALEIRSKARILASDTIELQQKTFDKWGLFLDWRKRYCTYDPSYVAEELRLFSDLHEKGLIFQDYLPVHFSPSSRTSLAESELEYNNRHVSPSLFLALSVAPEDRLRLLGVNLPLYLCIWTTTPWTLPANEAVCVAGDLTYSVVETRVGSRTIGLIWLAADAHRIPDLISSRCRHICTVPGKSLVGTRYHHPYKEGFRFVIEGSHVTSEGTGCVHTAPAHGREDFTVALRNGIDTSAQYVDEKGRYKPEAGPLLEGKSVLDEGNEAVINIIKSRVEDSDAALILNLSSITHSYPYDWRTRRPTLVRASKQWFFDVNKVKGEAKRALEEVKVHPEKLKKNIMKLLENRPYWCLSRQRAWGVPIPVFYEADSGQPFVNKQVIYHIANLVERDGPDVWWECSSEELLPSSEIESRRRRGRPLPIKGEDILDIWFDSGSSWRCALGGTDASDLCVEGLDQANGWFQSSLLLAVGATGRAPYKSLLLHNFTVDENKQKMSKSLGNVFDPELVTDGTNKSPAYGADVLRWWVSLCSPVRDILFGPRILEKSEADLRNIKNAFSFLLGSLRGFSKEQAVTLENLRSHDRYILSLIPPFMQEVRKNYEDFNLDGNSKCILDFIVQVIGNDYINSVKDILYFEDARDPRRLSVQSTMFYLVPYLISSIYPVAPILSEQLGMAFDEYHGNFDINRDCAVVAPSEWNTCELTQSDSLNFSRIVEMRREFEKQLEEMNEDQLKQGRVVDPILFRVNLKVDENWEQHLKMDLDNKGSYPDLCSFLRVSNIEVETDCNIKGYNMQVFKAGDHMCLRCRRYSENNVELCTRCENVLSNSR